MARASRSLTYATPEIIVTGSRCRIRCNAFADKPVLSANVENNGVSMSPSGSGIDFRCGCGPRGRPRFLAGSATVAQISAHWSALKQKSAHCSTSVALGMNGAIRCNVNAISPIVLARALARLRALGALATLPARGGSRQAARRSVACRAAVTVPAASPVLPSNGIELKLPSTALAVS
jgi:hypothetical protein